VGNDDFYPSDGRDPSLIRPYIADRMAGGGPFGPEAPFEPQNEYPPAHAFQREAPGLRPYLLTGGRVSSRDIDLEIEAQMATTALGRSATAHLAFERRDIVMLCVRPTAVAEIAAQLNLHLGVARVIVGDLIGEGYLAARRPEVGLERNVPIIERVIRGLQAIR
jgi:hypothetical protein